MKLEIEIYKEKKPPVPEFPSKNLFEGVDGIISICGEIVGTVKSFRIGAIEIIDNCTCKHCLTNVGNPMYLSIFGICVECMSKLENELDQDGL